MKNMVTQKLVLTPLYLTMKSFCDIQNYFDHLNKDWTHFDNRNDICTPMMCVKEMVDSIPNDFWNQKK